MSDLDDLVYSIVAQDGKRVLAEANARELLAALKSARNLIHSETIGQDQPQNIRVLAQIDIAIANAERRKP